MNEKRQQYLKEMGIDVWKTREAISTAHQNNASLANQTSENQTLWKELKEKVSTCTLCALNKARIQTVFGVGSEQADLLIIGEAPGANEDRQGKPFVGRAGMLLTNMFKAIGLARDDVYIANILKCRPPNNRDPSSEEVKICTSYLQQQIALIQPKLIVAVGRIAAQFLLNTENSLGKLRNKMHYYDMPLLSSKIPVLVTYHPAYLLRSPSQKSKAYEDLLNIRAAISKN